MVTTYGFLFPGQGAQKPGMIKDICEQFPVAQKSIENFSDILGTNVQKILWETDEKTLAQSNYSQIALSCVSLALVSVLKEEGITPSVCAGFSLGEWPALCVSGILSVENALYLVKRRGEIMQEVCTEIEIASQGNKPGMAAVIGLSPETIKDLVKTSGIEDLYPVNFNSPKQTVIAGTSQALQSAQEYFKTNGAKRVIVLHVAGPFHSPLMKKAAELFAQEVSAVSFNEPHCAIFSNVTGKQILDASLAKSLAIEHIVSPVLWTDEENSLCSYLNSIAQENWKLLEVGAGTVLSGFWKDSGLTGICQAVGKYDDIISLR